MMCGIAGFTGTRRDAPEVLGVMAATLIHRGPDEGGAHVTEDVALAVRRLSIIDVEHGTQPYFSESGDVVAVFNGEIYGFARLRERLARRGHRFMSNADGEVIVHAYEEYGEQFVTHIDGMFAIALWDERRRNLLLIRDRLGKKPLYVARRMDGGISFASELQALLADPMVTRQVSVPAIAQFLRFGYVPSPESCFLRTDKLAPGSMLIWSPSGMRHRRYWSVEYQPKLQIDYQEAVAEFRRLLSAAVRARMISDVPLGALLSGGMDSSSVVAHMVSASDRPVKTFSIGFADAGYDERPYARRVAEHLGTEHLADIVGAEDLAFILPKLVRHYGEPYADPSAVPSYYLARMARRHVTVALTGDGGDELLGGYDRHIAARVASSFDRLPPGVRRCLARTGTALAGPSANSKSLRQKAHRFFRSLDLPEGERFADWSGTLTAEERERLVPAVPRLASPAVMAHARHPLDRVLATDLEHYLPDDLLTKIDIASMACSLEARAPLLDYRLVEWTARLPANFKQRGLRRKRLLADSLGHALPADVFRRPKMGFAVPVGKWLRGELRELLTDTLLDRRSLDRGWADRAGLESAIQAHLSASTDHSRVLWTLLMLELWHREFADGPRPRAGAFLETGDARRNARTTSG
jgi:asparagine synthase (glutamine-hydrolysing)